MRHVFRHANGLRRWEPVLITQKIRGDWPGRRPVLVPRSPLREVARTISRWTGKPWQIQGIEARRILRFAEDCHLLHIFFGNSAIHMLPALRASRIPVIVSFHGSDVAGRMAGMGYRSALGEMFSRTTLVACRSAHLAARVHAMGCPKEKLRVMRAVIPDPPKSTKTLPEEGAWRILQAGRMVSKKGMPAALRAFAEFHRDHPGATLTIAGEGPLRESLLAQVRELGLGESVRMPGFLDQQALEEEFSRAHILLHPSETIAGDTEGVPNILLEAMARGLVPIATHHGGIPEAVEEGISGLLCPEADPGALARALRRVVSDPALYASLSQGASRRVASHFSNAAGVAAIEALYDEASRPPGAPSGR